LEVHPVTLPIVLLFLLPPTASDDPAAAEFGDGCERG
jgi:hypothetical protein